MVAFDTGSLTVLYVVVFMQIYSIYYMHMPCNVLLIVYCMPYRHTKVHGIEVTEWKQLCNCWSMLYVHTYHTKTEQTFSQEYSHFYQTTSHPPLFKLPGWQGHGLTWEWAHEEPSEDCTESSHRMRNHQQPLQPSPRRHWWVGKFVIHTHHWDPVQMLLIKLS